jgi:hypothetical protein
MALFHTRGLLHLARLVPAAAFVLCVCSGIGSAASNKELQRLKGTVGYQVGDAGTFNKVAGSYVLPDDSYAITQDKSAALLQLPDSSLVALGMNTKVLVGAFNQTADGPGATITVNGGALRFDIKRPTGSAANYHFVTPTSQVGVRGTIGLLAVLANGQTTVACLACAADSITVQVGGQSFALATGQAITVTATGAVTTSAVTSATLSGFSSAGVSTSATSGVAGATAGVTGAAVAPAAAAGAGAAAAAGAAAGAAAASAAKASPNPGPTVQGTIILQGRGIPAPAGPQRRPF